MTLIGNDPVSIDKEKLITENFRFILDHFGGWLFPRTIMTKAIGYQKEVFSEQEAMAYFKAANFQDCRINAYPKFTAYKSVNLTPISFVMMDLDLKDLDFSQEKLDVVLSATLNKIANKLHGAKPTVLWTGNGYHIYQPLNGFVLEKIDRFAQFIDPTKKDLTSRFMQFAEGYFTDKKGDSQHRPSIKSCLIRIPGTINSKCNQEVKIVQRWNGIRPPIKDVLRDFRSWLVSEIVQDKRKEKLCLKQSKSINNRFYNFGYTANSIPWIEKLLQIPIADNRKYAIWRILIPYLFNIKRLSATEAAEIIQAWLNKCHKVRPLDFNAEYLIKQSIRSRSGYPPISFTNLSSENKALYSNACQ